MAQIRPAPSRFAPNTLPLGNIHQPMRLATQGTMKPVNLFIGNIFSVALTGFGVPWVANRMGWWMFPKGNVLRANLLGAGLICAAYAISIWVFWKFF